MIRVLLVSLCITLASAGSSQAAKWLIPVNVNYVHGLLDVKDIMMDNIGEGAELQWYWPVGLSITPYLQLDNNLRIGFGAGPAQFMLTESDEAGNYFSLPVEISLGYTFFSRSSVAPYVKGGMVYRLAAGKNVKGSTPGALLGLGLELNRNGNYLYNLGVSYDFSEIEMAHRGIFFFPHEQVKPGQVNVSFGIVFRPGGR